MIDMNGLAAGLVLVMFCIASIVVTWVNLGRKGW